jgi:hypothetical protein
MMRATMLQSYSLGLLTALLGLISTALSTELLNPDGYLVGKFYQYSEGGGDIEAVNAWAINTCVPSGYTGYPYPNAYVLISSPFNSGASSYVTIVTYYGETCTGSVSNTQNVELNAHTGVGADPYMYFSAGLPNWDSFDYGYVLQKVYNYTGITDSTCSGEQDLLRASWYYTGCVFDCGGGGGSTCQWNGCAAQYDYSGGVGLVSIYSEEGCPAEDFVSTVVIESSCSETITCLSATKPGGLSRAAAIGITFAATLVGTIVIIFFIYRCCLRRWVLMRANNSNTETVEVRYPTAPPAYLVEPILNKNDNYASADVVSAVHVNQAGPINGKF